ncbi:MAG TPA: Omp28-related outer membrane protein [Ignavibacteria bacterium]|nr:Omp28-related outer membrane protein [Ignavibacteria bacterium]
MTGIKSIVLTAMFMFVFSPERSFSSPRNVLIEYVTGTWCGNCPCGHQTLNTISSQYPRTIIIAYHAFNSDPWKNFTGNEIVGLMGFSSTPTASIDRNNTVGNGNYSSWISGAQNRYASSPESRVNIDVVSKFFNKSTRELNLTVNATALQELAGQYKITFVITENNLIYEQNFYSNCGIPGIVPDYVHNHVTRTIVNGAQGEILNSGNSWNANQTFTKNISAVLDPSWVPSNCKIIAFVNKAESNFSLSMIEQAIEEDVTTVGITGNSNDVSGSFLLSQNYPNPFNPSTVIRYSLSENRFVELKVYDMTGKEVAGLVSKKQNAGIYEVKFNADNLSSGMYIYSLTAGNFSDKKKMLLLK